MNDTTTYKVVKAAAGYSTIEPRPSQEYLARFYAETYYQQQASATYQADYSTDELAQKRLRSALTIHAIQSVMRPQLKKHRLIDIGCGEGFMLAEADSAGFNAIGFDFSSYGIERFHPALANKVRKGDASALIREFIESGDQADVCILQNVLEHVLDPEDLMLSVQKMLSDGGIAAVTVPNDFSRVQRHLMDHRLSDHEYWVAPPQHLNYFNVKNLRSFMKSLSFDVVDAFGDFPIEMFLFHSGSNYVLDRSQGKGAHQARIALDLLLAEAGITAYHQFCQALTACGMGRNTTMILRRGP